MQDKEFEYLNKLKKISSYWIKHNCEHVAEHQEWMKDAQKLGFRGIADKLASVVCLLEEADKQFGLINEEIEAVLKQK
ncbi:MAG: hypothetical protein ACQEP5_01875 [Actinomycetota bacterium]